LAWKKAQKLGRFDPNAQSPEELMREQAEKDEAEVQKRGENRRQHLSFSFFPL
jgi:tubulin-folding cofactor B